MFRDAADKGVHALEMRFNLVCGTRLENRIYGDVVELADAADSKSADGDIVWVQVPPSPPRVPLRVCLLLLVPWIMKMHQ